MPNWELEKLRSVFCLLLDQPELLKYLWQGLNHISAEALMGKWRVYGGGLHKLELRELGHALGEKILEVLPERSSNNPVI